MEWGRLARGLQNWPRHWKARNRAKRPARIVRDSAVVSFSFDDFPRSAYERGGEVLRAHGMKSTYYLSMGLIGRDSILGPLADEDTVARVMGGGDEIGCHTFGHVDAWAVSARDFGESIDENADRFARMFPGQRFRSFAYPHGSATPAVKRMVESRFLCSRGVYRGINGGIVDRNLMAACPLYLAERGGPAYAQVLRTIDRAASSKGWLILFTHDLSDRPSPYGCHPAAFAGVVEHVASKGLETAPVGLAAEQSLSASGEEALVGQA